MLSLICAWTNGWVNTRDTGYFRRHRAHHDVTAMTNQLKLWQFWWTPILRNRHNHYIDVTMNKIASQITSLTIVCSTVYSGPDQTKHQSSASLAFVQGNSPGAGEFPTQMASNAPGNCFHLMTSSWRWIAGTMVRSKQVHSQNRELSGSNKYDRINSNRVVSWIEPGSLRCQDISKRDIVYRIWEYAFPWKISSIKMMDICLQTCIDKIYILTTINNDGIALILLQNQFF